MTKSKKIGLVTWLGGPNFGTVLQSYALYKAISSLGYDVTVLRHHSFIYGLKLQLGLREMFPGSETARKSAKMQAEELKVRTYITTHAYQRALKRCEALVCGSDQMWNTRFNFNPDFFLAGTVPGRKIAYAPSVGASDFASETKPAVKEYLKDFDCLSVREETGRRAVETLTGRKDVRVVLDPVFLPEPALWEDFAAKADEAPLQPYLLCYLLRKRGDYGKIVREVAAHYGVSKVVVVPAYENPDIHISGVTVLSGAGPREFVNLIRHASAVLTDSFHGTAFSVIAGKDLVSLKRFDDGDEASQNSRISDLLASLGLEDRSYDGNWRKPVDWKDVRARMASIREESLAYLSESLKNVR